MWRECIRSSLACALASDGQTKQSRRSPELWSFMLTGAAASLSEERAGQVDKKCEGDSTPRLQSLQVVSPGAALVDLYLNLEASSSRPSQPVS